MGKVECALNRFSLGYFISAQWMGPLFININVSSRKHAEGKKSLDADIHTHPFNITKTLTVAVA